MSSPPNGPGWGDEGWGRVSYGRPPQDTRRTPVVWALGVLIVVLLVALAGLVGYLLASDDDQPGVASAPTTTPSQSWTTSQAAASPPASASPSVSTQPPAASGAREGEAEVGASAGAAGDLGLATPMSRPSCDGRGIVVLYSAVTPGAYAEEISSALARHPGASYLRTDMACPSLRPRDENGNVIYAVYRPSGYTRGELCSDVRAAGPPAYGRWLDTTSDPTELVTC